MYSTWFGHIERHLLLRSITLIAFFIHLTDVHFDCRCKIISYWILFINVTVYFDVSGGLARREFQIRLVWNRPIRTSAAQWACLHQSSLGFLMLHFLFVGILGYIALLFFWHFTFFITCKPVICDFICVKKCFMCKKLCKHITQ